MTDQERNAMIREDALENAVACLTIRARAFADEAAKIERRIADLKLFLENPQHADRMATASDLFNWTINDIENVLRNLNFAEMARVGARLSASEDR